MAKKKTTAIVAGVVAAALVLGGTFAWTSISQQAKNEAAGIVNVGGRLHDDFNGKNKDVYVENFTDPLNGGQPIYARVKLTEYMEVGSEAGKLNEAGTDFDEGRNAASVIAGKDINNPSEWTIHKPIEDCAECYENGELCVFHEHWQWEMGGETVYMPTFNKDKDSLAADINGTYAGTDPTDKIYYDNYVEYVLTAEEGEENVPEASTADYDKIYSVVGTEYYDDDTDADDNGGTRQVGNVTHTAKQTSTATVITMEQWINDYGSQPGDYWVYDTDGWAYWANPIMPGEATGLLLSNIDMFKNPGEKCYYSINVVGQFATVNDWEYFTDGGNPSDDALRLLATAANNVTVVTVKNESNTTTVEVRDTVNFSATASVGGTVNESAAFDWAVYDADLNPVTTSTITNGVLAVGRNELNENLIIAATDTVSGAVGLSSVAVKQHKTLKISSKDNENILWKGLDLQFSAVMTQNGVEVDSSPDVTWSVNSDASNVDASGVLTATDAEVHGKTLTVTATLKTDPSVTGTFEVLYRDGYEYLKKEMPISTRVSEVTYIDGMWWYKLAENEGQALAWASDSITDADGAPVYIINDNLKWADSILRTYLNETYLPSLPVLNQYAVETTIHTANDGAREPGEDGTVEYTETTDKVFLLSEADLFGTANEITTTESKEYTFNNRLVTASGMLKAATYVDKTYQKEYALRSIAYNGQNSDLLVTVFCDSGFQTKSRANNNTFCLRPAMWVDISE